MVEFDMMYNLVLCRNVSKSIHLMLSEHLSTLLRGTILMCVYSSPLHVWCCRLHTAMHNVTNLMNETKGIIVTSLSQLISVVTICEIEGMYSIQLVLSSIIIIIIIMLISVSVQLCVYALNL